MSFILRQRNDTVFVLHQDVSIMQEETHTTTRAFRLRPIMKQGTGTASAEEIIGAE